ncbi:DUF4192 domain-containing protein [Streptomyces arenae]|nr:DUF4192 domain-containing protein [Streptomyces arenae]
MTGGACGPVGPERAVGPEGLGKPGDASVPSSNGPGLSGPSPSAQVGPSAQAGASGRTGFGDSQGLAGSLDEPVVTLRTPAELADALPYLLGFKPEESIVLIAMHGDRGRFGGRVRLGIPDRVGDWPCVAEQLAQCLVGGCERRGARPDGVVAFLCQEPVGPESGRQVMERLRPLAQVIRTACGSLDVPVFEVVCISDGRFWTYCCPDTRCCPPEGIPLLRPGTSVLAAAATYMGVRASATQREIRARLAPWETAAATDQERALDAAGLTLIPKLLSDEEGDVAAETLDLARRVMGRLEAAPPASGPGTLEADNRDDELIAHDEAAALILGLQVRTTRDCAAEWMEGGEALPALRLWRALARRCVGAYGEHAAAPLTLAGWVAWSLGDLTEGQEALDMALSADSGYTFARLLNHACHEDVDPESIRRCLRRQRDERIADAAQEREDAAEPRLEGPAEPPQPSRPAEALEEETPDASEGAPRWRRRRPPRSAGGETRTAGGSRGSGRSRAASTGPGPGPRTSGGSGTGPQNRRRTLRRNARNGR